MFMLRPAIFLLAILTYLPPVSSEDGGASSSAGSFEALIKKVRPSVATIKVRGRDGDEIGMGTGFVIDTDGLIATTFHVISEGRPFTVEMSSGRKLPVVSVEASDRTADLALVQVDVKGKPLPALSLAETEVPAQGTSVLAFGNPLGLQNSVVAGIVSAVREVDGREMIQLAMPIEAGNSGGPLVDSAANVVGIINMKSAIDDNLGFAIPISQLRPLRDKPNPVTLDRWVRLGRINPQKWTPLFGATWQQRGGLVTARGLGQGFGGRSLCLSTEPTLEAPLEIAVRVRLDDEGGAAGIAFHCDGQHRHYGFYPSNGRLRLTCFKGPSVYSWQVLEELESEHYLPGAWNRLRVRIEPDRLKCFVNGHLVIESTDQQLTTGKFGLVKFRDTKPDFKAFQFGASLPSPTLSDEAKKLLAEILENPGDLRVPDAGKISRLGRSSDAVIQELARHVRQLEQRAAQVRRLAADVQLAPTLGRLSELTSDQSAGHKRLLRGALLIAKLDDPDVDVDAYVQRVDEMADEVRSGLAEDADSIARREALHRYLFDENGFRGGLSEYYHPANSHLNRVIDDREGLPITLSLLYMELGQRIGITIEGVGLPGHFIVNHVIDDERQQLVDVFDRGRLLSRDDAQEIVATYARRRMTDRDLRAQTVVEILSRVLNNLVGVASRRQDIESIHRYCEALVAISPGSVQSRMMRAQIRAMAQRREGAIADLDWLIEKDPPGFDRTRAFELRQSLIGRGE
jgi:regulator of sirC expression with transglutaminase-like and TPR domain